MNWDLSRTPLPGDDVVIEAAGDVIVEFSQGGSAINSLVSDEELLLSGGELDITTTMQVNNVLTLSGGALRNTTILAGTGAHSLHIGVSPTFAGSYPELDNLTLATNAIMPPGVFATVRNGLTLNSASIAMQATGNRGNAFDVLNFVGDQTLGGTGEIIFDGSSSFNSLRPSGGTLTIAPGITVRTDAGGGEIGSGGQRVVSRGRISAETSNQTISFPVSSLWTNEGTIAASNDSLVRLQGTSDALGAIDARTGTVELAGVLNQAGQTITLDSSTGSLHLRGGRINGGSISGTGGAGLVMQFGGNILDGVTLSGDSALTLPNASRATVMNDLVLDNATVLFQGSGSTTSLDFTGTDQQLVGDGDVVFDGGVSNFVRPLGGGELTIQPNIVIRTGTGHGTVGDATLPLVNRGTISASTLARTINVIGGRMMNEGVLEATNGALQLAGAWTNRGTLRVTNGVLQLGGEFTTGGIGNVDRSGGTIEIVGALDNRAATFEMSPTTGSFELEQFGRITGGAIASNGTNMLIPRVGGVLDGVTLRGAMDMPAGSQITVFNGLNLDHSTVTMKAIGSGGPQFAAIFFDGDQVLGGSGEVVFAGASTFNLLNPTSGTLTIGPQVTVRGAAGLIGSQSWPLVNLGTIRAETSANTIQISASNFVNRGTLEAVGGGTIAVTPDVVIDGSGRLAGQPSGTIVLNGNLVGNTTNADQFDALARLRFSRFGNDPQLLEVMSADLGIGALASDYGFNYGSLVIPGNRKVKLVDDSDNSPGPNAESLYVDFLDVSGATLDLNGLNLYAKAAQFANSTILGGSVTLIPDSGPLERALLTPGSIRAPGEIDDWTFFERAGRAVTVVVDAGSAGASSPVVPNLIHVRAEILDADDHVLASSSSIGSGRLLSLHAVLPEDGEYRVRIQSPAEESSATGNYTVTLWNATEEIRPLILNQQFTGHIDGPFNLDRWTFAAEAGQQVTLDLIGAATAGIQFELRGPSGFVGFVDVSSDSGLVSLPTTGQYVLTVNGAPELTGYYTFRLLETTTIDLALGAVYAGAHAGSGHPRLFRVEVPENTPLLFALEDQSDDNRSELYVSFGVPPTRGEFDFRYMGPPSASPQFLVPMATAGTWFALLYADVVPSPGAYTLQATAANVLLQSVTPDHHGNGAAATLTLTGAGFTTGTAVELVAGDGTVFPAQSVEVDLPTQMTVGFALAGVPASVYSVRARRPEGTTSTLMESFEVVAGGESVLETNLIVPDALGRHALATLYIEYANRGDVAMDAPLLILTGTDGALLTLDRSRLAQGFWTSGVPDGFGATVQLLASGETPGVLQPGESFRIPVYFAGLQLPWDFSDSAVEFDLRFFNTEESTLINWNSLKDTLRPASIEADSWDPIFSNVETQVGATWGDFVRMLDDNASYLGRLGQRVLDVDALWAFEMQQAIGLSPLGQLTSEVDVALPTPGVSLSFGRTFSEALPDRFVTGPLGRGWSTPWQTYLEMEADGSVNIVGASGARRRFQPDSRNGRFFSQAGDHGALARSGSAYRLRELSGSVTGFRVDGKLDYVEDTNGNRITAAYLDDRLSSLTHSNSASLSLTYNAAGLISTVSSSDNRTATFIYDSSNEHLVAVEGHDGQKTNYVYDTVADSPSQHAILSIEAPDHRRQFFSYDEHGRLASTSRDGGAELVIYSYESAGKVTISDAVNASGKLFFDHRGLLVKTEDPLGRSTYSTFDNAFNLIRQIDATGQAVNFTYDRLGNVTSTTDQLGHSTTFSYGGAFNQLTSFTDARGNTTRYGYDTSGNRLTTTYPNETVERQTFDTLGNSDSYVNRRGQTIGYNSNAAGLVTQQSFDDGSHYDFTYDTRGNLLTATDQRGDTVFRYDSFDRMIRVTYPEGRRLMFTYDTAGRRRSVMTNDGFVTNYLYDAAGRLAGLTDNDDAMIITYNYDAAGHLERKDNGNGTYTTYGYDVAGQILRLINFQSSGLINSRVDYSYDTLGRRATQSTFDGNWTYSYDASGQLIHAVFASTNSEVPNQDLAYVYDAVGNRIRTVENGVLTEYTTNDLNQYTQVGETIYRYDADGNFVQSIGGQDAVATFDANGRLATYITSEGASTYEYDQFGHRTSATHDGNRIEFILDPSGFGDVVAEYGQHELMSRYYTHGYGLVRSNDSFGKAVTYDFDAIGSTIGITAETGLYTNKYSYSPFGDPLLIVENVANSFRYVGELGVTAEPSGLTFMRARYFDGGIAQFVSDDPIGLSGGDENFRRYAVNSPVNRSDASGLGYFGKRPLRSFPFFMVLSNVDDALNTEVAHEQYFFGDGKLPRNVGFGSDSKRIENDSSPGYVRTSGEYDDAVMRQALKNLEGKEGRYCLLFPGKKNNCQDFSDRLRAEYTRLDGKEPTPPGGTAGGDGGSGIAASGDPNQKTGPAGFGSSRFIPESLTVPYRVDFENLEEATAPAQRVEITDQLADTLDFDTLEFTEVGFGDYFVTVPSGSTHFETTIDVTQNGQDFEVQVELDFDSLTGEIDVVFQSIDPGTQLPPPVLTGFLPPEDGTRRGQGHFGYLVKPRDGLPTGTEIRNVALITFDFAQTIATNQVDPLDPGQGIDTAKEALNTIDAVGPSSQVVELPATSDQSSFLVTWAGQDDAGGSGVRDYTIYVSTNGAPFEVWLDNTPLTEVEYVGQDNTNYAFYSVARDQVGHVEGAPVGPDTTTRVQLPQSAALVDSNPAPNVVTAGAASGTPVGLTASLRGDEVGSVVYSLSNNACGRFAIDGGTGIVTVDDGSVISFGSAYTIGIGASDGVHSASAEFAIHTGMIIDNDDAGYADSGGLPLWNNQGFRGDVREDQAGGAVGTATFTLSDLIEGDVYNVATTWTPFGNRASDAPYTIRGIAGGPRTITVNQLDSPADFTDQGAAWRNLGTFKVDADGTLSVELAGSATGSVIVDAVRFEPVVGPEIEVTQGATNVASGGNIDFGATLVGSTLSRLFTVANLGVQDLELAGAIQLPAGFSLGDTLPATLFRGSATTLPSGDMATFQVTLETASAGTKSGLVSFVTNDGSEDPFAFRLDGLVGNGNLVIDNDDVGYSDSGNFLMWTNQGHAGDVREALQNGAVETATYTFTSLTPGDVFDVSATWTPYRNRAVDAAYQVSGAVGGAATVMVNQRLAPNDFSDAASGWETLGTFTVDGGRALTVQLSGSTTGNVIADAVRIDRRTDAEIQVAQGSANIESGGSSFQFGSSMVGATLTKLFTVKNIGADDLLLQPLTIPTGFMLVGDNFLAGQIVSPAGTASFTIGLDTAVAGGKSGTVSFASNDANENPFQIMLTGQVSPAVLVVDDGDSVGYSDSANMQVWGQGFQGDVREAVVGGAAQSATYVFAGLPAGTYRISATWTPYFNRADNARYTIDGSPVAINQKLSPGNSGSTPEGTNVLHAGTWFADLDSTLAFGGGDLVIGLSDNGSNGNVIIDAIRIERLGPLHVRSHVMASRATANVLSANLINRLLETAVGYWTSIDASNDEKLADVQVIVKDLPPAILGLGSSATTTIWLDNDGAGFGWSLEPRSGVAGRGVDLLTVITHELGHVLGLADLDPFSHDDDVMTGSLPAGLRRLSDSGASRLSAGTEWTSSMYRTSADRLFYLLGDVRDKANQFADDDAPLAVPKLLSVLAPSQSVHVDNHLPRGRSPRLDQEDAIDQLFNELIGDEKVDLE